MNKQYLRLKCLELVKTHLGPDEVIAQAEKFYQFCTEEKSVVPDVPQSDNLKIPPLPEQPGTSPKVTAGETAKT